MLSKHFFGKFPSPLHSFCLVLCTLSSSFTSGCILFFALCRWCGAASVLQLSSISLFSSHPNTTHYSLPVYVLCFFTIFSSLSILLYPISLLLSNTSHYNNSSILSPLLCTKKYILQHLHISLGKMCLGSVHPFISFTLVSSPKEGL